MASKKLHTEYMCDICGKKVVSENHPKTWSKFFLVDDTRYKNSNYCSVCHQRTSEEFKYDVCDTCFPKEYFSDQDAESLKEKQRSAFTRLAEMFKKKAGDLDE